MEFLDITEVLLHPVFEMLLGVSNVAFVGVQALNLVDHYGFPAMIVVAALFHSAITF